MLSSFNEVKNHTGILVCNGDVSFLWDNWKFDGGLVPSHYSGISYNVLEPSERLYM